MEPFIRELRDTHYTTHWIPSPLPFFISLFQLRLVPVLFISFCCVSLNCVFSLFLALPFQDRKGPITITKRRLSCAAYYSHYSNSQLVYPLHVHILFLLLFLLLLVECVAQGCVPRARSNNDRMLDQLIFFRFWFPVLLNPRFWWLLQYSVAFHCVGVLRYNLGCHNRDVVDYPLRIFGCLQRLVFVTCLHKPLKNLEKT